jgi:thymidylate synthase ThyX
MKINAKMIEDSISNRSRISTLEISFPKVLLAEFNTHRMFTRSFSSSRAIPVDKLVQQDTFHPLFWGINKPGMSASLEELNIDDKNEAIEIWENTINFCRNSSLRLAELGLHKQWANRCNDWYTMVTGIVTATDFDNFFNLRIHPDAQPEICELATKMKEAMDKSYPTVIWNIDIKSDSQNYWHLPYVTKAERLNYPVETLLKISTARCARVSYNNHDGTNPSVENDIKLHDRLVGSIPIHASPSEHQATPGFDSTLYYRNFKGWVQYRDIVEQKLSTLTTR